MAHIGLVALLVSDYDAAIDFYVSALGFRLVEDTRLDEDKRWVVVAPPGARETGLLLAKAATARQRDHDRMRAAGVRFTESPRHEPYGTVAVFEDLYGNRWDLIGPS